MIFIYDDNHTQGEGLGALIDFVEEPKVTQRGATFYEVEFSYFIDGQFNEYIKRNNKIKVRVDTDKYLPFIIYEVEPDYIDNTLHVTAELEFLHQLRKRAMPAITLNGTAYDMLYVLKGRLDEPYDFMLTGNSEFTTEIEAKDSNAFDVYKSIIDNTKVEVKFTERGIIVGERLGTVHREPIRESDYVTKMTVTENHSELVNRIIPVTTLKVDNAVKDEKRYKRETEEKLTYGEPVISPNLGNEKIRTQFVEYRNDVKEDKNFHYTIDNKDEVLEMSTYLYETVDDLNAKAKDFFKENVGVDQPKITINLTAMGLRPALYGALKRMDVYDVTPIHSDNKGHTYEVQVMERRYDPMADTIIDLKFSNETTSIAQASLNVNAGTASSQNQRVVDAKKEKRNQERLLNYIYNKQGNRIEFGQALPDPSLYQDGDVYFLETAEGGEVYSLKNGAWVYETGWNFGDQIKGVIDEMERKMAEMDKNFGAIQSRVDKELEDFNAQLDKVRKEADDKFGEVTDKLKNIDIDSLDDIRSEIDKLTETTNATVEILGGDGKTRYNKNRVDGLTDRTIPLGVDYTEVFHNGDGFEVGADYTISFRAECIKYASSDVLLKLVPDIVAPVTVVFKPTNELYPTIEKTTSKALTTIYEVYHDVYGIDLTSDWYKSIHIERTIDSGDDIELNVAFKEIAEGNLANNWIGEWSSEPKLIFDGN